MKIGDKIIEWSYTSWGKNDKHFIEHIITEITPSGRIRTNTGIELNKHLRIRGKNHRSYQTYFSLLNDEIKQEINLQHLKDSINEKLKNFDVHSLTENELEQLLDLLNSIKNRKNTD